jgi:hypothetical protein
MTSAEETIERVILDSPGWARLNACHAEIADLGAGNYSPPRNRGFRRQDAQVYPWPPRGMEQKGIRTKGTCARCQGHITKLQTAFPRIRNNLCKETALHESLLQALAYFFRMVVCSAVFHSVFSGVPLPLFFRCHMVAEHDGGSRHRHEAPEEFCLTLSKVLDGNDPRLAAGERLRDGVDNIGGIARHLLSVMLPTGGGYLLV